MPKGGARTGAGRPRKPLAAHVRSGTYRVDRHGPLAANVLPMPTQQPDWQPSADDLADVGPSGRTFLTEMLTRYQPEYVEGRVMLEAAHVTSALAAVRGIDRGGRTLKEHAQLDRLEQQWTRILAGLLAQLQRGATS